MVSAQESSLYIPVVRYKEVFFVLILGIVLAPKAQNLT